MENLYEQFIRERQYLRNVSPATIAAYRWAWLAFSPVLTGKDQLTKSDIVSRIGELRDKGLSPVSTNTYVRTLNAFFRWLHEEGHTERLTTIPKLKEPQTVIETFSEAQVKRVAAYKPRSDAERHVQAIACLILGSGLRIDEALSLDRDDVDLDNLLLTVRDGKGGKGRIVPISLRLRRLLFGHMRRFQPLHGSLLFHSGDGGKIDQRNALRAFKAICMRCGIKGVRTSFHTLRHTFATFYLRKGGDVFRLQRILGHASLEMTRRYVQLQTEDLRRVHDRLSLL